MGTLRQDMNLRAAPLRQNTLKLQDFFCTVFITCKQNLDLLYRFICYVLKNLSSEPISVQYVIHYN
jgi:hypothetical protein